MCVHAKLSPILRATLYYKKQKSVSDKYHKTVRQKVAQYLNYHKSINNRHTVANK